MSSESSPLTFGVEIEHVFAFHQSLLQAHLDDTKDTSSIVKEIDEETRRGMRLVPLRYLATRKLYNGWGLTGPTSYPSGEAESSYQEKFEEQLQNYGYRGYGNEPLHVAQKALSEKTIFTESALGVHVHDSFKRKPTDFGKWQLVNDVSLLGLPRDDLAAALEDKEEAGFSSVKAHQWDSHGIELVSRVLPFAKDSFKEIEDYLDVLKGKRAKRSRHRAFVSELCGLHVHIGHSTYLEQGEQRTGFPLSTLQHLAYILVVYEGAISTLFPSSRCGEGGISGMDLNSNRSKFFKEPTGATTDAPEPTFQQLQSPDYKVPPMEDSPPFCFREARSRIFAEEQSYESLANLMCPERVERNAIVNFMYTARGPGEGAQTVEFRQHEGCLDASGIQWWVKFCAGLLHFAERMVWRHGASPDYGGEGYKWVEWDEEIRIEDLMAEMEFEEEGKRWAEERKKRFAQET
ncbi:MAG: hypothetical protein OHK93_002461 [Ramalina farinacea]|uniref:Uncharacterized protein n=1 Tax=Ramalina farinacea TaxID=258253 RepID=A0AA43TX68_9LECA|nr:hypothetical protein [Ramalina farinacea]